MKLKLTPSILKLAYKFIDVESLGESSVLDGRTTEYGFTLSKLARLPAGKLLDVGCVSRINPIVSTMCELGWKVYGIDIREYKYSHPNFKFVRGDITGVILEESFFDAITVISTLEHIGIKGRYGITKEDNEGPLKTMGQIKKLLKPGGLLIITLPVSNDGKASSLGRLYTPAAVSQITKGWEVVNMRVEPGLVLLHLMREEE